ncbi:hydroxymethylglutaryl-CoA reductase, degradative [Streptococcus loxodontisalivarius]|uniref:3-hydroxy-3-methylglutaryl coenzyme A reductase n=1 Tax=Streptococcus loxodontisalivarius TaxID=1349415 RepID=A0ABS2PT53_9STRE|nr:hydroxymethylglutaryl-CoA reductase, degradative [Streptococcus loxodontisalivarius]MBM7643121.1 hydroxymethylglutaryl-CoA reductase [Streptococcus loxodontisalivarius]
MTKLSWTGFSKKTPHERLEHLTSNALLSHEDKEILNSKGLELATANQMAENVLSTLSLPFALAPDFQVNGKDYQLPMVTEEPSVVAAASYAAKLIKRSGGFKTEIHNRLMIGQVALFDVADKATASQAILNQKADLLDLANQAHPSILKRGGGSRDLWFEEKSDFLIVYLSVDTQEAMGANMVNTMMETLVPNLEELSGGQSLMAILSNYATESLVTATAAVDLRYLSRNKEEAQLFAKKMEMASQLAQVDPYRAATHNKGIFNGVDALVLATGNDWRAIEAGAHAYASRDDQYRGLSTWTYDKESQQIKGEITLPLPIATKGGSIGLNPTVQVAHDLLGNPSAKELAGLIAALGLAQNFAALKALTSTGIQAGHMKLQAKSLALLAGAKEDQVASLVSQLLKEKHMNLETAEKLLKKL